MVMEAAVQFLLWWWLGGGVVCKVEVVLCCCWGCDNIQLIHLSNLGCLIKPGQVDISTSLETALPGFAFMPHTSAGGAFATKPIQQKICVRHW